MVQKSLLGKISLSTKGGMRIWDTTGLASPPGSDQQEQPEGFEEQQGAFS